MSYQTLQTVQPFLSFHESTALGLCGYTLDYLKPG